MLFILRDLITIILLIEASRYKYTNTYYLKQEKAVFFQNLYFLSIFTIFVALFTIYTRVRDKKKA